MQVTKFIYLKLLIMKKIIAWSLIGCVLLSSWAFASDIKTTKIAPALYNSIELEPTLYSGIEDTSVRDLIKKHELVIRNNNLESDYEYNSSHYYTSKMKAEDIIVPSEIINKAKKVYFLVEEWQNRMFFAEDAMLKWSADIATVKKEYNYKIVDFKSWKDEYIFNNKDLIKDFSDDKYTSVQITLIAEFSDTEKVPLSNTTYISINDKKGVLNQLNSETKEYSYFGYYNSNDLEEYLENISSKMKRSEYKKILQKADKKIKSSVEKNEKNMDETLSSIKKESDFKKHIETYRVYNETQRLLRSLWTATTNQLQNIRAFDAIDAILK